MVKHNTSTDSILSVLGSRTMFFTCIKLIVRGNDPFLLVEITSGIVSPDYNFRWPKCLVNKRKRLEEWAEFIFLPGWTREVKKKKIVCYRRYMAAGLEGTESGNI